MTQDEQMTWLDQHTYRDPRFADTEFTIRRKAVEIVDLVLREGSMDTIVLVPSGDHELGWRRVHIHKHDLIRIGGLEQILLVEEILRRAMNDGGPGS